MSEDIGISIPKKFDPADHVNRHLKKALPNWKINKSKNPEVLSGGNLNYTWRVFAESPTQAQSIIVKHAPPFIASKPNIPLDAQRIAFEYHALKFVNSQNEIVDSTGRPPQVLFYDSKCSALWMEDLGSIPNLIEWVQQSTDKQHASVVGNNIGRFIARLHASTYNQNNMAMEFNNRDIQNTRLELMYKQVPQVLSQYVVDSSSNNNSKPIKLSKEELEAIRAAVVALGTKLADITQSVCLTMGDLWPLSILLESNHDIRVIDWEFSHYGYFLFKILLTYSRNPLQDVAHLASHLWMLQHTSENVLQREVAQEVLDSFLASYKDELKNRDCVLYMSSDSTHDSSIHFACEIIQRTIGMFNNYLYSTFPSNSPKITEATQHAISVLLHPKEDTLFGVYN